MREHVLIGLTLIAVLGILAQWIAWRTRLPTILLLLVFGIGAGPVTNLLDVNELFGELLFPVVSLSVAIILFEGGLGLRLADLREIGRVVRNLITIGVAITWAIAALAARLLLNLDWSLALILGAILVVTGPTVVIPMLQQIRPARRVSTILRWEGIVIDPVGAVLAVLVFEEILSGGATFNAAFVGIGKTILIGGVLGWISARALVEAFRRYWVPDTLQNPVALIVVVAVFTLSNVLQTESGLLTVTVMGIVMANQRRFDIVHIAEFKENLQILLLSVLFILLGAHLRFEAMSEISFVNVLLYLGILMLVARPLAVWVSAYGSDLLWREKLFLAWMAPRGVVASAVASIFAVELVAHGYPEADVLTPLTFSVIIGTVAIYSLTSGPLANWLGLVPADPQGILCIGAHNWVRSMALKIQELGFRVVLVDVNPRNVERAAEVGLEAHQGDILDESVVREINLSGIGSVLAMTPNDEVNSLACLHFKGVFPAEEIFQLPRREVPDEDSYLPLRLGGRNLFGENVTCEYLSTRFNAGADIYSIDVKDVEVLAERLHMIVPLFVVTEDRKLLMWTPTDPPQLKVGDTLLGLIDPDDVEHLVTQEIPEVSPAVPADHEVAEERREAAIRSVRSGEENG